MVGLRPYEVVTLIELGTGTPDEEIEVSLAFDDPLLANIDAKFREWLREMVTGESVYSNESHCIVSQKFFCIACTDHKYG